MTGDASVGDPPLRARLDALVAQGRTLETEGLPFPTDQVVRAFDQAMAERTPAQATTVLRRAEALLARVRTDWTWVRELLRRVDELRAVAEAIGVDVAHLDHRVGNPREHLANEPLSAGSLEKAAASASLALAVLNDTVPKFIVREAEPLGASIRRARDRGEDVRESAKTFALLLQAVQDHNVPTAAKRLVETRRSVARIPRAPAMPAISPKEEEEILSEARNLARRLQQIKGKARNAQSAARLMAQVRAAISEERRYGTPEEEIEALWAEVDRLTKEKKRASAGPPLAPGPQDNGSESLAEPIPADRPPPEPAAAPPSTLPTGAEAPERPEESEDSGERLYRSSLYVPYSPPDYPAPGAPPDYPAPGGEEAAASAEALGRGRPRPRGRP